MAISQINPVNNSAPASMEVSSQNSPAGRSLLSDFEQVNNVDNQIDELAKLTSLKLDTKVDPIKSGPSDISPTSVINPTVSSVKESKGPSSLPLVSSEDAAPIVKAAQDVSEPNSTNVSVLNFKLHHSLTKVLTQPQLNRISFYGGIIHDINKEVSEMASNDTSNFVGQNLNSVFIDEEQWLIDTIANRKKEEKSGLQDVCPSTFSEAIGEKDAEICDIDPVSNLNSSRTQLWKPSRSWWEARSGKNPWIEPSYHNKRWRYLWPLIHYHKFLARCIKKLKRNGVEVRSTHSPVCVFLREEVCAISDHLATISKFTAEEWVESLAFFHGWTHSSEEYESSLRNAVSKLKLRSVLDLTDVESPILRDQIDEKFLKAMENNRLNMKEGARHGIHERVERKLLGTISEVNTLVPNTFGGHVNALNGRRNISHDIPNHNSRNVSSLHYNQPMMNNRFKNIAKKKRLPYRSQQRKVMNDQPFTQMAYNHEEGNLFDPHTGYGPGNSYLYQKNPLDVDCLRNNINPMHHQQHSSVNAQQVFYRNQFVSNQINGFPRPPVMPMYDPFNNVVGHNYYGSIMYPHAVNGGAYSQPDDYHQMCMNQPSPTTDTALPTQNPAQVPSLYWDHLDPMSGIASPHPAGKSYDATHKPSLNIKTPNHSSKPQFSTMHHNLYPQFGNGYIPQSPATQFLMTQTPQASGYYNNAINMASHAMPSTFTFDSPNQSDETKLAHNNEGDKPTISSPKIQIDISNNDQDDESQAKSEK